MDHIDAASPSQNRPNVPDENPAAALGERARSVVQQGEDVSDADRLRLVEELYGELEHELERDLDQISATRR